MMPKITIKARIERFGKDELLLKSEPGFIRWLSEFKGLDLRVQFSEYRAQRSLTQNAKLWALISEIDIAENGRASEDGEMAVYCNLIKMARVKTELIMAERDALEEMIRRKIFRHIEILQEYNDNVVSCRCYYGSSTFDTKEMSDLIESALDYATNLGINIDEYKEN